MKVNYILGLLVLTVCTALGVESPIKAAPAQATMYTDTLKDDLFEFKIEQDGTLGLYYKWDDPAVVYAVTVQDGQIVQPGRDMLVLNIKAKTKPARSKAHVEATAGYTVMHVGVAESDHVQKGDLLMTLTPMVIAHDSTSKAEIKGGLKFGETFMNLVRSTGVYDIIHQTQNDWTLGVGKLIMIFVGLVLLYLAIFKGFEPLLLVPIGFGAILANIPLAGISGPDGLLGMVYTVGVATGVFPLIIFMGVGAMTDFGPLIANPKTALLGAAAQAGIFIALLGAASMGGLFSLKDAAAIGIIGGADGPTAIFLASRLSPNLLGAIAVAAYSYMALVPIIQPPIMRFFTTTEERKTKMVQLRAVSKLEKVCFPLSIVLLCAMVLPDAAPLIGALMFGNLMRECGVVERLSSTAQNALINIVTIFLGLCVGSKLSADKFLNIQTLGILAMGLVAFMIGTTCGVMLGKVMYRLSGKKINPLIGAAGVSAVPMAARVVNKVGLEEDPHNFLLMHAMGSNVAGVIGSAVAAGVLLNALKLLA